MASSKSNKVQIFERISEIPKTQWDACVGTDEPFARYDFLYALEESGCTTAETGWLPQHFVLFDDQGHVVACAPSYLKGHSYGEYVFDWSWADAYERAGGRYYPKLQSAIPFSPVPGHRFLLSAQAPSDAREILLKAMIEKTTRLGLSSFHVTFCTQEEAQFMGQQDMMIRQGHQYHWLNQGYDSFDDFLQMLSSRKRKNLKKERRAVENSDIEINVLTGGQIQENHWDSFYKFYMDTSGRKWGHPYLNRDFFSLIGQRMSETIVLVLVETSERIVAGALNLAGSETLFGRYWGCLEDYKFLHFEACYYQAIDYAIAHKLKRVEAGAQGQHKIQRGYLPVTTYSAHWVPDPGFQTAIENFLEHDKAVNKREMEALNAYSPYKKLDD